MRSISITKSDNSKNVIKFAPQNKKYNGKNI